MPAVVSFNRSKLTFLIALLYVAYGSKTACTKVITIFAFIK